MHIGRHPWRTCLHVRCSMARRVALGRQAKGHAERQLDLTALPRVISCARASQRTCGLRQELYRGRRGLPSPPHPRLGVAFKFQLRYVYIHIRDYVLRTYGVCIRAYLPTLTSTTQSPDSQLVLDLLCKGDGKGIGPSGPSARMPLRSHDPRAALLLLRNMLHVTIRDSCVRMSFCVYIRESIYIDPTYLHVQYRPVYLSNTLCTCHTHKSCMLATQNTASGAPRTCLVAKQINPAANPPSRCMYV